MDPTTAAAARCSSRQIFRTWSWFCSHDHRLEDVLFYSNHFRQFNTLSGSRSVAATLYFFYASCTFPSLPYILTSFEDSSCWGSYKRLLSLFSNSMSFSRQSAVSLRNPPQCCFPAERSFFFWSPLLSVLKELRSGSSLCQHPVPVPPIVLPKLKTLTDFVLTFLPTAREKPKQTLCCQNQPENCSSCGGKVASSRFCITAFEQSQVAIRAISRDNLR